MGSRRRWPRRNGGRLDFLSGGFPACVACCRGRMDGLAARLHGIASDPCADRRSLGLRHTAAAGLRHGHPATADSGADPVDDHAGRSLPLGAIGCGIALGQSALSQSAVLRRPYHRLSDRLVWACRLDPAGAATTSARIGAGSARAGRPHRAGVDCHLCGGRHDNVARSALRIQRLRYDRDFRDGAVGPVGVGFCRRTRIAARRRNGAQPWPAAVGARGAVGLPRFHAGLDHLAVGSGGRGPLVHRSLDRRLGRRSSRRSRPVISCCHSSP